MAQPCRILLRNSSPPVVETSVSLTVSIGATVLSRTDTVDTLLWRVDQALHQSKRDGCDRTTLLVPPWQISPQL